MVLRIDVLVIFEWADSDECCVRGVGEGGARGDGVLRDRHHARYPLPGKAP